MYLKKRTLTLLLILALLVSMFAACGPRNVEAPGDDERQPPDRPGITQDDDVRRIGDFTPDYSEEIADRHAINDHTVGWLDVPGTNISDVVVRNPECRNNLYYLRRNFYRQHYFNGIFYIDFRADLGPTREYLGVNTTIYGHAMTDDIYAEAFDIMFGNLHLFREPDFMRMHPYIFFSLPEDNLAFEIMAVFYGNSSNPEFSYNNNHSNPVWGTGNAEDFIYVVENAVLPRSLFHFDVEFDANDRFLTLSTCIYNPTGGVTLLHYSLTEYRFAIMARLVDPDEPMRRYASFTINEDRIVDPDGPWPR